MAKGVFDPSIVFEDVCIAGHMRRGSRSPLYAKGYFEADTVEYYLDPEVNGQKRHLEYAIFHVKEPETPSCREDVDMVGVYRIPIEICTMYRLPA